MAGPTGPNTDRFIDQFNRPGTAEYAEEQGRERLGRIHEAERCVADLEHEGFSEITSYRRVNGRPHRTSMSVGLADPYYEKSNLEFGVRTINVEGDIEREALYVGGSREPIPLPPDLMKVPWDKLENLHGNLSALNPGQGEVGRVEVKRASYVPYF